ncbi:lysine histidine transporter-like 7 [Silene latifolia]|uniref:lysine histidine transporter-like 7 n=1 Tax=Silene latifolia TaxID=37657 RepID=UPI003D782695
MWKTSLKQLMQEDEENKTTFPTSLECLPISISHHGPMWSSRFSKSTRVNPVEVDTHGSSGSSGNDTKITVEDDVEEKIVEEEFNPEAWLPITESRNGNLFYCIFHLISSGIGIQSLALPFAFVSLGWVWGIMWLSIAFIWQLYTLWLLVRLHESNSGHRYSRYLQLAMSAFGPKLGKLLALFPVMYLSGGTCVMLLITGGNTMQNLHQILGENGLIGHTRSLTTVEWYLVFICLAIAITQLPNLNSIAWVSLVSSITAVAYCSLIWVLSVTEGAGPSSPEYKPGFKGPETGLSQVMTVISAVGVISLSFRGHNLVLEIQGTLPTNPKDPTHRRMWRGVIVSYGLIALCLFPLAIGGFWAYGTLIPKTGLLNAFGKFHGNHSSKLPMAVIYFLLIINSLCSFQIYAMPVFDNLELRVVTIRKKPCTWLIRTGLRLFFGGLAFLISVAFPFLPLLSPLIGGIALPVTFAYPCFMWISIKKPDRFGSVYWLNLVLGCLGILLSVLLVTAAIFNLVTEGISANFFHPKP